MSDSKPYKYEGCGDNGCLFFKPKVGTNGGCRCLKNIRPASLKIEVSRQLWALKKRHEADLRQRDELLAALKGIVSTRFAEEFRNADPFKIARAAIAKAESEA